MKGGIASLEAAIEFSMAKWFRQTCSFSSISQKKTKLAPLQERKMIDRFKLFAKGGDGGNGCASFRRSRHERRGRPDGGNGGKGGDVVLECSTTVWDFSGLQHHINAKRGGNGAPKNMIGSRGADKVVQVPIGTVIHLLQGEVPTFVEKKPSGSVDPWEIPDKLDPGFSEFREPSFTRETRKLDMKKAGEPEKFRSSAQKLSQHDTAFSLEDEFQNQPQAHSLTAGNRQYSALGNETSMFEPEFEEDLLDINEVIELTEPGEQVMVARGGNGGFGNLHTPRGFNISNHDNENANDEPSLDNLGQPGSETLVMLELKTIADVGLVGMPNAGKSTLLGALSRAKPRVGHYAFTTLRPNLGKLNYDDISITVADVPGLIRGAHENRGLGHAFLRHIERTKVLAYVVDLGRKDTPPWEQLRDLILELEMYNSNLSDRPSLIVANKIDEEGAENALEQLRRRVAHVPIFPVCAVLEEGIQELKTGLKELVSPVEVEQDSLKLKIEHILLD